MQYSWTGLQRSSTLFCRLDFVAVDYIYPTLMIQYVGSVRHILDVKMSFI